MSTIFSSALHTNGLLVSVQKQLISQLSPTLESKSVFVSERGLTSTQWSEYSENTKRIQYSAVPTSDITAEAVTVDGFMLSQKDTAGVVTTATRPLTIQKDATWYTYGWDLSKNICEVYGQHGYIRTAYTYTPYGQVTAIGDTEQTFQWSSEFNNSEFCLVYYNYRHYNPVDGRWIGRDRVIRLNHYVQGMNNCISNCDYLGQFEYASSDVEYVFDEGVDPRWKKKVAAVTDTYFPKINATKVKYEKKKGCTQIVFPNQQYIPKIICYKGAKCNERMMDKFIPNSKDQSLRKHELHHTSITSSYWNSFVNEAKMIEMLQYRTKKRGASCI